MIKTTVFSIKQNKRTVKHFTKAFEIANFNLHLYLKTLAFYFLLFNLGFKAGWCLPRG
jgi:hypothetical protein